MQLVHQVRQQVLADLSGVTVRWCADVRRLGKIFWIEVFDKYLKSFAVILRMLIQIHAESGHGLRRSLLANAFHLLRGVSELVNGIKCEKH